MSIKLHEIAQHTSLEILARQMVEGFITGMHKSPYHGFSVEFAEHRLYNDGESTRHIDWKVYARTDRLFSKRYEEETNLRATIIPTLAKTHKVYALELQGHGRTTDINRPITYPNMADDVAAFMDAVGIEKADVFGYSMGARTALATALAAPDRVSNLILGGVGARMLEQFGVIHAGRASCHAGEAAQAEVHFLREGAGRLEAIIGNCAHECDATAGAVSLQFGGIVSGACGQAKTAVHALLHHGIVEVLQIRRRRFHRGIRHPPRRRA